MSTIERRLATITTRYRSAGTLLDRRDRHITDVLAGIRRTHGQSPTQESVLGEDVLATATALSNDLRGVADRATLLVGSAGGLRRIKIVGLNRGPGHTQDGEGWLRTKHPDMVLLYGGSPEGAELIAQKWAEHRGVTPVAFKPDWTKHLKAAPFKRNDTILDVLPTGVVVFPGTGTQGNLADKAKKIGIPLFDFRKAGA